MRLTPGQRLDRHEVLAPLSAGGMGEVYRARDPRLDREVAIKVLLADRMADAARRWAFVQEAKAASAQPPAHRHDPRDRGGRRHRLHRHGVGAGQDARRASVSRRTSRRRSWESHGEGITGREPRSEPPATSRCRLADFHPPQPPATAAANNPVNRGLSARWRSRRE